MPSPQIVIVGAGVGGSCLAALLARRGVSFQLIDKLQRVPDYSYTISLQPRAYRPLLSALGWDDDILNRHAVSAEADGSLKILRSVFESMLRSHGDRAIETRWNSPLSAIARDSSGKSQLELENGSTLEADLVVAADGVHSKVRTSLLQDTVPSVLPFAVFNGKRRISLGLARDYFGHTNAHDSLLCGSTRLTYSSVDRHDASEPHASVSYTFSRPLRSRQDPLDNLQRSVGGATEIPAALFDEIAALSTLSPAFKAVFHPDHVHNDRLLHWLMRTVLISRNDLDRISEMRNTIFIGDAAHATPILGGNGANEAILDAIAFANSLDGSHALASESFYTQRYDPWRKAVDLSEERLRQLHVADERSAL